MAMWMAATLFVAGTLAPSLPPQLPPSSAPPTTAEILAVPPALHAQLEQQVLRKARSSQERARLLIGFIFDDAGIGLTYDATQTRTVAEVYQSRKANCLSFTLLFVALARQAGLDAHGQEVGKVLSWYEDANTFYSAGHVNAGMQIGGAQWTTDLDRNVLASPEGPKAISDRRLYAHFFNNRGSELMAAGQSAAAEIHFRKAIALAPDLTQTWNNLGVLQMRRGDRAAAEASYLTALDVDRSNAPALSNLVTLFRRNGDSQNAELYLRRLQRAQSGDPFLQYILAGEAEQAGRYPEAVSHYRRAIRLFGDAHQFHFGLARTYFLMGDAAGARRELARARDLGGERDLRKRYQDKLDSLQRWIRQANAQDHARLSTSASALR